MRRKGDPLYSDLGLCPDACSVLRLLSSIPFLLLLFVSISRNRIELNRFSIRYSRIERVAYSFVITTSHFVFTCCRIAALSLQSLSRVCDIAFLNNRVASSQGCYTIRFSLVRLEHSKLRSSWPRIDHSNDTYTIFFYSSTLLLSMYRHCGLGVFVMSHCTTIRFPVARIHSTSKAYPRTAGFQTAKVLSFAVSPHEGEGRAAFSRNG